MTELALFLASYVMVFALGFQSRNVNEGHYGLAFMTNALIGTMNFMVLKMVPSASGWSEMLAYVAGGPLGIISAMYVHKKLSERF